MVAEGRPLLAEAITDALALLIRQARRTALALLAVAGTLAGARPVGWPITHLRRARTAVRLRTVTAFAAFTRELLARAGLGLPAARRGAIAGATVGSLLLAALRAVEALLTLTIRAAAALLLPALGAALALAAIGALTGALADPALAAVDTLATPGSAIDAILSRLGAADLRAAIASTRSLGPVGPAGALPLERAPLRWAAPLGAGAAAATGSWARPGRRRPTGYAATLAPRTRLRRNHGRTCRE